MRLQESGEMYLETIYLLKKKKDFVRSIDVALEMNFSKPSISRAVGLLRDNGYVTINDNGGLELTPEGLSIAEVTYERHAVLASLFKSLGVSENTAEEDACRIEHVISKETFDALKKHLQEKA